MLTMDKSSIGIRRALTSDLQALEIVREASISAGGVVSMTVHLENSGTFTYLAEERDPFGFVTVGPCQLDLAEGEVFEWYLLPAYQQRAFGIRLLIHGLSVLKRRLCENALIWVPSVAVRAEHIIERQGFELTEAIRERNVGQATVTDKGWIRDLTDFF